MANAEAWPVRGLTASKQFKEHFYVERLADDECRRLIFAGTNLADRFETSEFSSLITKQIKRRDDFRVILIILPPAIFRAIHLDGCRDELKRSIPGIWRLLFNSGLSEKERERIEVFFHPGPLQLTAVIRDPDDDERGVIAITPRWFTDKDSGGRAFFSATRRTDDERLLFSALYSQIVPSLRSERATDFVQEVKRMISRGLYHLDKNTNELVINATMAEDWLNAEGNTFTNEQRQSRKIFVVHGKDRGPKEAVARFLKRFDFEPIILHEQLDDGETIIEKFIRFSDVGYAIILMTPDDIGAEKNNVSTLPRARQNVILEHGYFIGKLGRKRVIALRKGDVELPNDLSGVLYKEFDDNDAWQRQLLAALEGAGFVVDWTKFGQIA